MNLLQGATELIAAFSDDPQGQRLLRLEFPNEDGPPSMMLANALVAEETVSRDFIFTVEVLSDDARIPLKPLMGKMVTISLVRDDGSLRYFNGYVFAFRMLKTDGGFAFYEMVLKPWLAFLRLRQDCMAYQNLTLTELFDQMFLNYDQRDYRYDLVSQAPMLKLAVQYNESDYNHFHRRLEAWHGHYFYEHRRDGHTLVIGDDSTLADPIDGDGVMDFQSQAGALEDDGVSQWSPARRVGQGRVTLNSYNFKIAGSERPERDSMNRQGDVASYEVYEDTGGYGFKNYQDGEAAAQRRMEAIDARGQDFAARSNDRRAEPRRSFKLAGHFSGGYQPVGPGEPSGDDVSEREYLILSVRHDASNNYQDGKGAASYYENTFTCLRKSIPWRPQRGFNSRDVRIHGIQSARVVGPQGEEIHTDEFGRVRVRFQWDRKGKSDQASSPMVRVMTGWAGARYGQMHIPRIGQEVIVMFIDGNCDRPMIIGSAYNDSNMPPWELPANKTQSGILTRSTRGGNRETANALRFEDKKGAEEVWLHAERDLRGEVERNESHTVGNDRRKTVAHDETVEVKHDRTETVGNDEKITVHGKRGERVDHDEEIDIGENRTESVGGNESIAIAGGKIEQVTMAKAELIGLAKTLDIGGAYGVAVGAMMHTLVGDSQFTKVIAGKSTEVGTTYSIDAGSALEIVVGAASLHMSADGAVTIKGSSIDIGASGPVRINGKDVDLN
ncbi:type VI secretion system Vgr family protein [Rugamonas sp. DEMB1]|uniref:type VI secretion system Vgr family protein n=1 Tax=Rugamonas sp. DEMB1 TaxID=3039386 RepID=UPI00244A4774|nr:type VI secretion system tip protein TssI/VgrG [Rugamonas sp. DEMB1]WGG52037.1 type VI secretion system tip protein TssI/VgrG [Rugamonas sp. DEMB1]